MGVYEVWFVGVCVCIVGIYDQCVDVCVVCMYFCQMFVVDGDWCCVEMVFGEYVCDCCVFVDGNDQYVFVIWFVDVCFCLVECDVGDGMQLGGID